MSDWFTDETERARRFITALSAAQPSAVAKTLDPRCPRCGSVELEETLIGVIGGDGTYDPNFVSCGKCGWRGKEAELRVVRARPEVREVPWWEVVSEIASEANISRAFVTYHARDDNGVSEVAIVSWWYKTPSLVALFRGAELVGGELLEKGRP